MFETDPTGIFFQFKAAAIGEFETEVEETLKKEYKESLSVEDAIKLGIKALVKVLGKEANADRIDAAYISADKKKFARLDKKEIEKIVNVYKKGQ